MDRQWLLSLAVFVICLSNSGARNSDTSPPPAPPEKWADAGVKLPEGVALWLDASRLKEAWQTHGKTTLKTGSAIDVWYDSSGNGLDLVQRHQAAQPKFVEAGSSAVVRFEGGQWLEQTAARTKLESCTLFVLAAPRSNAGGFRALFAVNETGKNDYVTGFNVDMGPGGTSDWSQVNVEGRGFGGVRNLLTDARPMGDFRLLAVTCRTGPDGVQLLVEGKPAGRRDRSAGILAMDQITLGARCYSNTAEPPFVTGFLDGDIAEVILFKRVLGEEERKLVSDYLMKKHAGLKQSLASTPITQGHLLKTVANPPAVQFLVPGFTVKELPVDLPNINNVRYREDGKLVALGYNGNIYLLSGGKDTGLEDKVELFWENKGSLRSPIGMALTPKGYAKGQGVFVAAKGKVVLIVDTDGDGKADKEIVVAQGWKELSHGVDALGVALDKDNNVYFGLGCADYTNAYLKSGDKSLYDLKSERGTIQKVSADFSKRETVCTGIRFSVGMAFNKAGDLFCTDQEGATWLPNGNPFDELLHIQPGRHYGFPPRHPKFLPHVVDEPSTFDFGPQHQSTCGLCFNESVNGGPTFGPKEWAGDAFVCGESRGKLYRTRLVKSMDLVLHGEERAGPEGAQPVGYVAQNQLLACLQSLTIDACVSPGGDLVVACHSGPPDWGTGPQGKGKLFKIFYSDPTTPQPVLAWSSGPREVRIAFDKPLDPQTLKEVAKNVKIERGAFVRPGDRFETLGPPYAVVKQQRATPRFDVPVHGVQIAADRRTLIVATGVLTEAGSYAITLPRPGVEKDKGIKQHDVTDLGFDLAGVETTWEGEGKSQTVWLPHIDLDVSRKFTTGSSEHEAFFKHLEKPAKLKFKTQLNLWRMLPPAVQAGSTLDYTELPEEIRLWVVTRSSSFDVDLVDAGKPSSIREGAYGQLFRVTPKERQWIAANISIQEDQFSRGGFKVYFETMEARDNQRSRPLALNRFLLPWATSNPTPEFANQRDLPQLKGGSWARGKDVFFSDNAQCSRCHQIAGKGGKIGPDLGNLIHRDYDSVLRDIRFPSATLNPDHISYLISLKDGRVLTGTLRSEGEKLFVGTIEGKEIAIRPSDIETSTPSPISVMPEGLDKKLSADEMRDLLTFLLTQPEKAFQPAPLERAGAPPLRKKAELDAVMKNADRPKGKLKKLNVVLAAGPKDHGPGEHDYPLWQKRWQYILQKSPEVIVDTAFGWPSDKQWQNADVIVFFSFHEGWKADRAKDLDAFLERGGGLVYLHWAVAGKDAPEVLAKRIGLAAGKIKFRHGPLDLEFDGKHPITRGFSKLSLVDESYWNMTGDIEQINVIGTGVEEDKGRPLFWTRTQGKGKVYVCIPGHYTWTFDDPLFRILVLRGICWTAGEAVDRLSDLATIGARMAD